MGPAAMNDAQRLSAQQLKLLQLVATGITTSKVLAQHTGLTPGSIDTYLQAAARTLGASGRIDAARQLEKLAEESSQSASQLRTKSLLIRIKSILIGAARGVRRFTTGLPIGGKLQALTPLRIAMEVFRVALLGVAGVACLALIVRGAMWTLR